MSIELLYFEGCPHYEAFAPHLDELVRAHAPGAVVDHVEVPDEAAARRLHFLGSPSVRIDGCDVDPSAAARTDFGLQCRLYRFGDGFIGAPPDAMILAAIHRS